jgi:3-hydroxyisobutyrate dehydrogenase
MPTVEPNAAPDGIAGDGTGPAQDAERSVVTVGIVGLGLMGAAAARRLLACGYVVVGHDIVPAKVTAAEGWGVAPAGSAREVAERADIVLVSVMKPADLTAVVLGAEGIAAATVRRARVVVDLSTMPMATTRDIAERLAAAGGPDFVDAPVSGGPAAAEAGTLAIMAGGAEAALTSARPLLERLGTCTHMGPLGSGQATKLVNQVLVLSNYCVLAEAFHLASTLGVDPARIPAALGGGHAGSNLLPVLFERMVARDFAPRGYAHQVLKDLRMLGDAAASVGAPLPMAEAARSLFEDLVAAGSGDLDGSAVLHAYEGGVPRRS